MKNFYSLAILILAGILFTGCGAPRMYSVGTGSIANKGVTIKFEEGQYLIEKHLGKKNVVWEYGKNFKALPEIQSRLSYWSNRKPSAGKPCNDGTLGCYKVKVKIPGYKKEFYGKIFLSKIYDRDSGPGTRSYYIQIPNSYVKEARNGNISVVYEWVRYSPKYLHTVWVLWFSDRPF